jgi:hypothetical protein
MIQKVTGGISKRPKIIARHVTPVALLSDVRSHIGSSEINLSGKLEIALHDQKLDYPIANRLYQRLARVAKYSFFLGTKTFEMTKMPEPVLCVYYVIHL